MGYVKSENVIVWSYRQFDAGKKKIPNIDMDHGLYFINVVYKGKIKNGPNSPGLQRAMHLHLFLIKIFK